MSTLNRGSVTRAIAAVAALTGNGPGQFVVRNGPRQYVPSGEKLDMSKTIFQRFEYETTDGKEVREIRPVLGPGVKFFLGTCYLHDTEGHPVVINMNGQPTNAIRLPIQAHNFVEAFLNFDATFAPAIKAINDTIAAEAAKEKDHGEGQAGQR